MFRRALRLLAICALLPVLFVVLLTAVYALPQRSIPQHLRTSAIVLNAEGVYPSRFFSGTPFLQDNYTDALMLDTTVRQESDSPLVSAMAGAHGGPPPIVGLAQTAKGDRSRVSHYSYYWSGYQVMLRPLAMWFDYSQIRRINLGVLLVLTVIVAGMLWRALGWKGTVAFLASLLVCGFIIVPWSLQYSNMTYLMLFAMIAVLAALDQGCLEHYEWEIFLVAGMLAAFFDLLTTPLLSLGMPLAIILMVRAKSATHGRFRAQTIYAVTASALWSLGYLVSWSAKIVFGTAILREGIAAQALHQFAFRAGAVEGVSRFAVIELNFRQMYPLYLKGTVSPLGLQLEMAVGVIVFLAIAVIAVDTLRRRGPGVRVPSSIAGLLVVPLPYIWYAIASNHSQIHVKYTYRIQAFAVFAVLYFVFNVAESAISRRDHSPDAGFRSP